MCNSAKSIYYLGESIHDNKTEVKIFDVTLSDSITLINANLYKRANTISREYISAK